MTNANTCNKIIIKCGLSTVYSAAVAAFLSASYFIYLNVHVNNCICARTDNDGRHYRRCLKFGVCFVADLSPCRERQKQLL